MTSPQVSGEPGVTNQSKEYFVHFVIDLSLQRFEFSYPSLFGGFTAPAVLYPQLGLKFYWYTLLISLLFWFPLSSSHMPSVCHKDRKSCAFCHEGGAFWWQPDFSALAFFVIVGKSKFIGLHVLVAWKTGKWERRGEEDGRVFWGEKRVLHRHSVLPVNSSYWL